MSLNLVRLMGLTFLASAAPVVLAYAVLAQSPAPGPAPGQPPEQAAPSSRPASGANGAAQKAKGLLGLEVFSSDGRRLGMVEGVKEAPDGKVVELHVKVGGVLGIGARIVSVPGDRFARTGERVQLAMTADEAGKLPPVEAPRG